MASEKKERSKFKNPINSIPVKIISFLMFIVSVATFALSAVGVWFFYDCQYYTHTKDYIREDTLINMSENDAYSIMYYTYLEMSDLNSVNTLDRYYHPNETSLRYRVLSNDGQVIRANDDNDQAPWTYSYTYEVRHLNGGGFEIFDHRFVEDPDPENTYKIELYFDDVTGFHDKYLAAMLFVDITYALKNAVFIIGGSAVLMMLLCFVLLMCGAGRRYGVEGVFDGVLTPIPFDLLVGVAGGWCILNLFLLDRVQYQIGEIAFVFLLGASALLWVVGFLWLCIELAIRLKKQEFWEKTVIYRFIVFWINLFKKIFSAISKILKSLPLMVTASIAVLANALADVALMLGFLSHMEEFSAIVWCVKSILVAFVILYFVKSFKKLKKGAEALSKGDFSYKTETSDMIGELKVHGEYLNSASKGMAASVEKSIKSERTKTELITNVSHDIKTPLTSIINYASLIAKDECDRPEHKEYSEVLVRKSAHLKRLLEDIVEISKANSGNLEILPEICDASVLLLQISGEYENRFASAGLELITKVPEQPLVISVDGRRMWRVFENLMNNACKYSLSGTRVYLTLEKVGDNAVFYIRNTSAVELNISPDELMARFVRGDHSRTTEGNGLGLSIAESLTRLQGGTMEITIDGDLFKIALSFPTVT